LLGVFAAAAFWSSLFGLHRFDTMAAKRAASGCFLCVGRFDRVWFLRGGVGAAPFHLSGSFVFGAVAFAWSFWDVEKGFIMYHGTTNWRKAVV
jgi:hypothetical protein